MKYLIKINMPWRYRLQNFRFKKDGTVFWTSASKSIKQKMARFIKGDKSQMCNTSDGYTLVSHGQDISQEPNDNGRYFPVALQPYKRPDNAGYLQGIWDNLSVYGKPSKEDIVISHLKAGESNRYFYKDFAKWYWKYWEAEGICRDDNGNLWVGISVKTRFGILINYRYLVN